MPTPRQLFRMLDDGRITREAFREAMSLHLREIIVEMEEVRANPVAAWIEGMRNKRAAAKLVHRHGEPLVRELFVALSEVPDFPPAGLLWNADRQEMPLHCFIRSRAEPVFRVLAIASEPFAVSITVEHGTARRGQGTREKIVFNRDRFGRLGMMERGRA